MGGPTRSPFTMSLDSAYDMWESFIEPHHHYVIEDDISSTLADRDFSRKHKKLTTESLFSNPALLQELNDRVNEYKWELMLNGIENFKLVPRKKSRKN